MAWCWGGGLEVLWSEDQAGRLLGEPVSLAVLAVQGPRCPGGTGLVLPGRRKNGLVVEGGEESGGTAGLFWEEGKEVWGFKIGQILEPGYHSYI